MTKSHWESWEPMPLDEFERRIQEVNAAAETFIGFVHERLPGLITLDQEERDHAPRLRKDEHPQLKAALDVADAHVEAFKSLSDQDDGMDPGKFETGLLRDRIDKHAAFVKLVEKMKPLSQLSDSALYLADKLGGARAAYRLAKALYDAGDPVARRLLDPAVKYYRRNALVGLATKAAHKDGK